MLKRERREKGKKGAGGGIRRQKKICFYSKLGRKFYSIAKSAGRCRSLFLLYLPVLYFLYFIHSLALPRLKWTCMAMPGPLAERAPNGHALICVNRQAGIIRSNYFGRCHCFRFGGYTSRQARAFFHRTSARPESPLGSSRLVQANFPSPWHTGHRLR